VLDTIDSVVFHQLFVEYALRLFAVRNVSFGPQPVAALESAASRRLRSNRELCEPHAIEGPSIPLRFRRAPGLESETKRDHLKINQKLYCRAAELTDPLPAQSNNITLPRRHPDTYGLSVRPTCNPGCNSLVVHNMHGIQKISHGRAPGKALKRMAM
jgi:hypothetical protein